MAQYLLNDALNAYGQTTPATVIDAGGSALLLLLVMMVVVTGGCRIALFIAAMTIAYAAQSAGAPALLRGGGSRSARATTA